MCVRCEVGLVTDVDSVSCCLMHIEGCCGFPRKIIPSVGQLYVESTL